MFELSLEVSPVPENVDLATAMLAEIKPKVITTAIATTGYDIRRVSGQLTQSAAEAEQAEVAYEQTYRGDNVVHISRRKARRELENALASQQTVELGLKELMVSQAVANQVSNRSRELAKPLRAILATLGALSFAGGIAYLGNHVSSDMSEKAARYSTSPADRTAADSSANATRLTSIAVGSALGVPGGALFGIYTAETLESREVRRRARKIVRKAAG
jgi:hypothetical protein